MKKIILTTLILLPLFLSAQYINRDGYSIWQGQMSVGKPNTTRAPSYSWLEVGKDSTTRGLLLPRVVNTSAVTAPGRGLVVYSIEDSSVKFYTGSQWLTPSTSAVGWGLSGNNITAGQFIGTTNSESLLFKVNNIKGGLIDHVGFNTSLGYLSQFTGSGTGNTSIGRGSLQTNTGDNNIGIGYNAGAHNTTGSDQIFLNSIARANYAADTAQSPFYALQGAVASQRIRLNGRIFADYIPNTVESNVVYYNSTSKEFSYGAVAASGVTAMGAIGASPNANGATISGSTLNLEPASTSFGGIVTTSTQGIGGFKYFPNNIGLGTITSSGSSSYLIEGSQSNTGFSRIFLKNTNTGNGAGVGAIYQNDASKSLQYYMGSEANLYSPSAAYFRSSGDNGIKFAHEVAGSKVRFSNTNSPSGIESGVYLKFDADEFSHIAIPQAPSMTSKTVLVYDSTGGGIFYQISKDSVGGTGGSMVYPSAGIAVSTGAAWAASITDNSANWNTAYTDRLKWDGGATDLVAGTGRTSLGGTTIGQNFFTLTNPSAVTYPRMNADNSITPRTLAEVVTDLGVGATFRNPELGDTLLTNPGTDTFLIKSLIAGTNVTFDVDDTTITINASGGGGTPGGSTTQMQYNNAGAFAGTSGATATSTQVTLAKPSINNIAGTYTTTATAAGTTTLTVTSTYDQYFTGATTQTVVMPDATTLTVGMGYRIVNNSTGVVTVNKNGGTLIKAVAAGHELFVQVTDISSAAGTYSSAYSTDLAVGTGTATNITFDAGTTSVSPINMAAGTLKTTAGDGDIEVDADAMYGTTDAGNRGVITVAQFIRADATRTYTSNTSSQTIFDSPASGALTLETGLYEFEGMLAWTAMSGTSGNRSVDILGAGSATVAAWMWSLDGIDNSSLSALVDLDNAFLTTNTSAASCVTAGTGTGLRVRVKGTFEVTGAGTIIPSTTMVTAAASVLSIGSILKFNRIGSTSAVSVGQWN